MITSLYCLHNIEDKNERAKALSQIVRVLKPGGVAFLGEYFPTNEYREFFEKAGFRVEQKQYIATALAPMWIVRVEKSR
ncbi:hypothetical protein DSM106972_086350 [Dulcicalothrix desertica PCC 7102]|uniref:Methyltransferase type 11 domain-containing protein n=1 Tax=Dulcicalothrix desertica PCC 7102 TaxID=232991 RepID=A0A3S1C7A5_9CYAN|nr:hypothetical protein DSM106972_086350 [Dulcicalothrix desertica PCC 7102]